MTERAKMQYDHFVKGINKLIKGPREQQFEDSLVDFITYVGLDDMTEEEKSVFYSQTLLNTAAGRKIKEVLENYFEVKNNELMKQNSFKNA